MHGVVGCAGTRGFWILVGVWFFAIYGSLCERVLGGGFANAVVSLGLRPVEVV